MTSPDSSKELDQRPIQTILMAFSNPTNNNAGHHSVVYAERLVEDLIALVVQEARKEGKIEGRRIQAEATLNRWKEIDPAAEYMFGAFLQGQAEAHSYEANELKNGGTK